MSSYLFRINREKWDALVKLRGWKHPITCLARRTGFTKSYCSQAINGGIPVSHDFMLALVEVAGASPKELEEWASLFEIVKIPIGERPGGRYQSQNYAKYEGKTAYKEGSLFGSMRKEDKAKGLTRLDMPNPIPAMDYYDDAAPRRVRVQHRFKR